MLSWVRIVVTLGVVIVALLLWQRGYLLQEPAASIIWSTESEVDTAGFHVYRATSEEGPYERVTEELIPSAGDPFTGSNYQFRDREVERGVTYYYQLEELETTGRFNRLPDTTSYSVPTELNWLVVAGLLAPLLVVWLLPGPAQDRRPVASREPLA